MRIRNRARTKVAVALILVAACTFFSFDYIRIGTEIANFQGVPAYHNGILAFRGYGKKSQIAGHHGPRKEHLRLGDSSGPAQHSPWLGPVSKRSGDAATSGRSPCLYDLALRTCCDRDSSQRGLNSNYSAECLGAGYGHRANENTRWAYLFCGRIKDRWRRRLAESSELTSSF